MGCFWKAITKTKGYLDGYKEGYSAVAEKPLSEFVASKLSRKAITKTKGYKEGYLDGYKEGCSAGVKEALASKFQMLASFTRIVYPSFGTLITIECFIPEQQQQFCFKQLPRLLETLLNCKVTVSGNRFTVKAPSCLTVAIIRKLWA